MNIIKKPSEGEYKAYTSAYIDLLPDDADVVKQLDANAKEINKLIKPLSDEQLNYRYAEGKWNLKEMLIHMMDTERIFSIRALRIARNDKANLPGYNQDDYVPNSAANDRNSADILKEYQTVRASTLSLFSYFTPKQLKRIGTADGHPASVRALIYMTAGHEMHHINIMKERYLSHFKKPPSDR